MKFHAYVVQGTMEDMALECEEFWNIQDNRLKAIYLLWHIPESLGSPHVQRLAEELRGDERLRDLLS